jgi:predicted phage terminase large subunit-like protein
MTRDEVRQKALTDGLFLGTKILGYDFCEDVHRELFNYKLDPSLPLYDQPIVKDELILWPRGHYKTTARVVQAIQFILNFPDIRIVLMQGTKKLSEGLLAEIKSHFSGDNVTSRLIEFFPEAKLVKVGTKQAFTVPTRQRKHLKEPTCAIASGKSVKASQHYDLGIFDDLVNEQNFRNQTTVAQVTQDFHHCQSLIDPGGFRRVSGTRYTFGDLYEQIIRSNTNGGHWTISVKTCWLDEVKRIPLFPARKLPSGRTIGFTRELLDQMERDDPETFSAQQLNRPIAAKSHYFPAALIQSRIKVPPAGLSAAVVFIDLASSRRIESDHRIILTGRADSMGGMYVTALAGGHYPPAELAKKIIETSLEHHPLRVLIEKTAPAIYLAELIRIIAHQDNLAIPIDFIEVQNNKDAKYLRIAAVAGFLPRLWFAPGLENWDRLVEEFDHFPKGSHDDYPDTVGLMVQWFSKNMPLMRPDPMQAAFAQSPYTSPSEIHTQMPVSTSEYSLGSDFLS